MKNLLLLLMLTIAFSGCLVLKKQEKSPPPSTDITERIVEKEKIVLKDTIIYRHVPGAEVQIEVPVKIKTPVPMYQPVTIDTMMIENEHAIAFAWINNSIMGMKLYTKPKTFQFNLQNQYLYNYKSNNKDTTVTKTIKVVPLFYKIILYIFLLQLIFIAAYLLYRYKSATIRRYFTG